MILPFEGRRLTTRQREALQRLADGYTLKEAALAMGITYATFKSHLYEARYRLDASTTTQAVAVAVQRGEVRVEEVCSA